MSFALALLAAVGAGPLDSPPPENPPPERPTNVLLIMADDLGAEWLSCYNPAAPPTPHLDALAASGTRFARCFSQPLCTPSRVVLMTGKYNYRNYVEFGFLPPEERTIGDLFQDAGYRTGVFGKWQLSGDGPDRPDKIDPADWGFDEHLLWQLSKRPGHGNKGPRYWAPKLEAGGAILPSDKDDYGPDRFVDALLDFVKRDDARPFLAYYPMVLTHDPFLQTPETGPPAGKAQADKEHFPEMVRYTDRLIGRLVAGLEAAGLRENTAILFCGDNGTHQSVVCPTPHGPYRGGKGLLNDRGTWVPLIVSLPGRVPAGATDERPVDFTDLLPTVCTLAGVPAPADGDGVSPFAGDGGPTEARRTAAFVWYDPRHNARINRQAGAFARDERYRLHADGRFFDAGDPLDPAEEELTEPLTEAQERARSALSSELDRHAKQGGGPPGSAAAPE
ncbi:sulfatase-like hydrolase/transferase [Alienimonas sp. DA493]|uniref:sulfatase-like hydrolase/transferase n=1 Tax=Alienimonas sp. DA493 TaxID=3373605 RepID=UPI003754FD2F